MIIKFWGNDRAAFADEADQMFRLRADVLSRQLAWNVQIVDGWETDEFDSANPLYVLAVKDKRVVGCARLLPTTGPTLLTGPLASSFDDSVDLQSPLILECSRVAIADGAPQGRTPAGACKTTVDLTLAICDILIEAGIPLCVGVFSDATMSAYKRIGWAPEPLAYSKNQALGMTVGLWEAHEAVAERLRDRHGFSDRALPMRPTNPKGLARITSSEPHVMH